MIFHGLLPLLNLRNHGHSAAGSALLRSTAFSIEYPASARWSTRPPTLDSFFKYYPQAAAGPTRCWISPTVSTFTGCFTATTSHAMPSLPWFGTEARVVEMLQTYRDGDRKPVKDLTTWLEGQKLILLESLIRSAIETIPALPFGYASEVAHQKKEEWCWQMDSRHIKLTELEQEFREIYKTDIVNVDAIEEPSGVPDTTVELTIEHSHVQHQNPGDTTEQQDVPPSDPVTLQLPATVESDLSSPILIQHSETLLMEVSPAQSQSELMDDEEA